MLLVLKMKKKKKKSQNWYHRIKKDKMDNGESFIQYTMIKRV